MRKLHKTIFSLCAGLILAGCAGVGIGGDHIRWTEEVRLSDGKVIQIQRHVELTDSGFPVQKRGFDRYQEICYPPMNIHWKSKAGYKPDIFDIVDGKAYMHVPISDCFQCMLHDYPSSDALYFVWKSGQWKRITREDFPSASEWNLLMQTKGGATATDPQGLITIGDKATGKWNDSGLRFEKERLGWKRVSESYSRKGKCNACRNTKVTTDETPGIFIDGSARSCQP
ncbi:MAG: hypothetical protein Q8J99_20565 [Sulfuritalea sp.]|nr:hypothetical protein [Sulfuritalea sp.]